MRGKIRYQKELQKTYLVAEECGKERLENYCGQMVLRGRIRGLAKCGIHLMDGRREIWYDISFLQPLEQVFAVKELVYHDLRQLTLHMIQVVNEMERYLLDGGQLCFEPQFLYWDMETETPVFLFDFTEDDTINSLRALGEFILERSCHEEEKTVDLAYFLYEKLSGESFSVKEVEQYLEEHGDWTADKHTVPERIEKETKSTGIEITEDTDRRIKPATEEKENSRENTETYDAEKSLLWNESYHREDPEKKSLFSGRRGKRYTESGLACILTAILSGIGYFLIRKYFILEEKEMMLWAGAGICLLAAGVIFIFCGYLAGKREEWEKRGENRQNTEYERIKDKKGKREEADKDRKQDHYSQEEEYWQWQEEEMSVDHKMEENRADQKTVYIGKALLNRGYSLVSLGKGEEKEYSVEFYPYVIGKDKERVNLYLKEHSVSRIHARLLEENGDIYIEDLHSTNGTYLNDLILTPHEKIKIRRGDIILFGKAEFAFR